MGQVTLGIDFGACFELPQRSDVIRDLIREEVRRAFPSSGQVTLRGSEIGVDFGINSFVVDIPLKADVPHWFDADIDMQLGLEVFPVDGRVVEGRSQAAELVAARDAAHARRVVSHNPDFRAITLTDDQDKVLFLSSLPLGSPVFSTPAPELVKEALRTIQDMSRRERAIFAPLIVMTLLLGVYPSLVTDIIGPSVGALISEHQAALPPSGDTALAQN